MSGFTLLEMVITVSILVTVTVLVAVAWPKVREEQALLLAREQLQTFFHQAQQAALNEQRPAACLERVGGKPEQQRRCSDVGVVITQATVRLFADTTGDNNQYNPGDFILVEQTLPLSVVGAGDGSQSFLFRDTPPLLNLFGPRGEQVTAQKPAQLRLRAGRRVVTYIVRPYGQLEQ